MQATAEAYGHRAGWKLPRRSGGMDALRTEGYAGKRPAEHCKRFKGLKARKRQAWTPLQTDGWGEWRDEAFETWQTA